ncbi:MAG: aspartokinase/homoserine dehydrogenase 1, partial [Flavobacteriales bacterium]
SADEIRSIRGVFSGSLSYIFNNFSASDVSFSEVLLKAKAGGFTEPDPREDLSGQDVARKLLILAREVGAQVELADVEIQNLIPTELRNEGEFEDFIKRNLELDSHYENLKENLKSNEVLRYVGNLDLVENKMTVELVTAKADSPLGSIKNADSIIEIYTQNYGDQPIVIQGAGAGANVTANGVYSDLLRIGAQM